MKTGLINKNKGFTLLEALVAISILMVAVVAPITIAQKGLSSSYYSKNQMIASYLAQDAIEYIKNIRDMNVINENPWLDRLDLCLGVNICMIDTNANVGEGEVMADDETPLKIQDGFYGFYGDDTNFTRTIKITKQEISGVDDQAMITVTVSWGAIENTIIVKTLIFNI